MTATTPTHGGGRWAVADRRDALPVAVAFGIDQGEQKVDKWAQVAALANDTFVSQRTLAVSL